MVILPSLVEDSGKEDATMNFSLDTVLDGSQNSDGSLVRCAAF